MLEEQDTPTSPVHAFDVYDNVDFSGSLLVESSEETEGRGGVAAEDDTSTEEVLARESSRFSSEHDDFSQLTIALVDCLREGDEGGRSEGTVTCIQQNQTRQELDPVRASSCSLLCKFASSA